MPTYFDKREIEAVSPETFRRLTENRSSAPSLFWPYPEPPPESKCKGGLIWFDPEEGTIKQRDIANRNWITIGELDEDECFRLRRMHCPAAPSVGDSEPHDSEVIVTATAAHTATDGVSPLDDDDDEASDDDETATGGPTQSDWESAMERAEEYGFSSISCGKIEFAFNGTQATILGVMWQARKSGCPVLHQGEILTRAFENDEVSDSSKPRLRDRFGRTKHGKREQHPAWHALIVPEKPGYYQLSLPPRPPVDPAVK